MEKVAYIELDLKDAETNIRISAGITVHSDVHALELLRKKRKLEDLLIDLLKQDFYIERIK